MVERDVGILGRDLIGHGSPQARGGQHVRLVDLGHLAAPRPGEIERQAHDPGDLALVVGKRVESGPVAGEAGRLATIAEVDPAGQLAHDDHVDANQQLRADGRRGGQGRLDTDGPHIRVQAQSAPQREERLFRTDRGIRVGPSGATDRAKQDRVGRAAVGQVLVPDRDAVRIDGDATNQVLRPSDREVEASAGLVDHAPRRRDDLRAHPVAGDRRDAIPRASRRREVGLRHGIPSP